MMTRPNKDAWAMGIALWTAQRATCLRRSVGAVLLDAKGFVLATGYNGVASGLPHCNETAQAGKVYNSVEIVAYPNACQGSQLPSGQGYDLCGAVHAEQNALLQCRDSQAIHTVYCTTAPCVTCTKLLMNTSAQRIVYLESHVQSEPSRKLWEALGRSWEPYSGPSLAGCFLLLSESCVV